MLMEPLRIGSVTLDPAMIWLALAGAAVLALLLLAIALIVHMRGRRRESSAQEAQLTELKVRLQTFAEISVSRHGDLARAVNERLDRMTHRVGTDLNETSRKTHESISKLNERLAVIDTAQKNLTELSTNMVSLQEILANKQARGAFGQMRMETIVQDGLPKGAYTFQATLSNGKRPDCLIRLPNHDAGIVIDAKFPLEGFEALRGARAEAERSQAAKRIKIDVSRHIDEIASRYFISGETQDSAILFVPSESIYAELHENFPDLIQKAYRERIVLASPNMLMLMVQTVQAVLKDVRMRQQAGLIQKEVSSLMADVRRLGERVLKLQQHFSQANEDIDNVLISSDKIAARGRRIEGMEFDEAPAAIEPASTPSPAATLATPPAPARGDSKVRLRGMERSQVGGYRQPDLLAKEP